MTSRLEDMVAGYLVGLEKPHVAIPACYSDKSTAWRHGWVNGRDDAWGKPSTRASVNRRRADMILGDEK